jgi:hypothetical protein
MRPRRQKHGGYKAGLGSPKLCAVLVQIDCEKRSVIGADIMTRLVVFVHADSLLANAVHLMLKHKISARRHRAGVIIAQRRPSTKVVYRLGDREFLNLPPNRDSAFIHRPPSACHE